MKKLHLKSQSWKETFINAANGCYYAFSTQKNFKIHLSVSFLVILLAIWLKISFEEFLLLILAIYLGLTIEMANTAFEKTVDLITEEYRLNAKIAKDVAAGMMLLVSVGLAIIGILIFLPLIWQKFVTG